MRAILLIGLLVMTSNLEAQTFLPGTFGNYRYNNFHVNDSSSANKWSINRYGAISGSLIFFNGGNASVISAPVGLQLNRRLTNNLYAFAGASVTPAYVTFNRAFIANNYNKGNQGSIFSSNGNPGLYSRAELGLQYINDDKTFSISGSIGVERNSYPMLPYSQMNTTRTRPVLPANKTIAPH